MVRQKVNASNKVCSYCSGTGYLQLLLGGSETCQGCEGTGIKQNTEVVMGTRAPLNKIFDFVIHSRQ